jgi:hypothetical protein
MSYKRETDTICLRAGHIRHRVAGEGARFRIEERSIARNQEMKLRCVEFMARGWCEGRLTRGKGIKLMPILRRSL